MEKWLPLAELWYNSSFHTSLGCSPFKALYAYEPNLALAPSLRSDVVPTVADMVHNREIHIQALKQHLALEFAVGAQVLLKLQPNIQTSVANRPYPKLAFKYYGPYEVIHKMNCQKGV
jgi:hypothetical protein